ncbi:MAG: farnesyl-diphosphate farnesyltransferase [Verrucomicrobiales bacterium]|nr:farnesyl-diphosphate farnesyltransferase [Verrucomicrobiales bacterium]|tara:strand:+ start:12752 stop:13801 length:1050 start_codon:yes stop_codon:yes gene_type:complete
MPDSPVHRTETPHAQSPLLTSLLRDVSRSFYLTMRALPNSIRPQISLAYLLARATDTIADTDLIPLDDRLNSLNVLRERILGTREIPVNFGKLAEHQANPSEQVLLRRVEEALTVLGSFSYSDQIRIREVLNTITTGQELDLKRFHQDEQKELISLENDDELDDYTYKVAGCVGEFWTKTCRSHLFPKAAMDDSTLLENGIRFGKGLQLVNILRDLPRDLEQGRCYIPRQKLDAIGLRPPDLLDPNMEPAFRALYHGYLDKAENHLMAGWEYTNSLPKRFVRLRLACSWPILIGDRTIAKLRRANILNRQTVVKIRRSEVYSIICGSILRYPFPGIWRNLLVRPKSVNS